MRSSMRASKFLETREMNEMVASVHPTNKAVLAVFGLMRWFRLLGVLSIRL